MIATAVDCDQRSDEWFAARAGRLTGSCAHIIYAKPRKGSPESVQRRDLRVALALERLTGKTLEETEYLGRDVERGVEREAEARAAYEARTGRLVATVGFLAHPELMIGVSPDGLVDEGGLELKCPKPAIQLQRIRENVVPEDYTYQILHGLFVTGLPWWEFVSYCPALPAPLDLFIKRVTATDAELKAHALAVALFLSEVEQEQTRIDGLRQQLAAPTGA